MTPLKGGWLLYSVLALLAWGVWGILPKAASSYISPKGIFVYHLLGSLIVGAVALTFLGFRPEPSAKGAALSVLGGALSSAGALFFYYALSRGKASVVVTFTALYPIVTIILSILILRERISSQQALGMALALLAMALLGK